MDLDDLPDNAEIQPVGVPDSAVTCGCLQNETKTAPAV